MKRLLALLLMLAMCMGLANVASADITPVQPKGSGTEADPYLIGTAAELYWYAKNVNSNSTVRQSYAELTDHITVNQGVLNADGSLSSNAASFEVWTPIGNAYRAAYTGHFDGKGYTISGLYYVGAYNTATYVGFFGNVGANAVIKNVTIADSYFSGKDAGGIAGQVSAAGAAFENCHNKATVVAHTVGNGGVAGGIVGSTKKVTITGCSNEGMIYINTDYAPTKNETSKAGGLVGSGTGITIYNSYNTGSVTGISWVGGLVGMGSGAITMEKCYNTGTITGNPSGNIANTGIYVGGILGSHNSTTASEIKDCYNAGSITGANSVGGIAGSYSWTNDKITNSHNYGSVNSGGTAYSFSSVKVPTNCYYLSTLPEDTRAIAKTAEEFTDGSLVTLLNAGRTGSEAVWTQGENYPVFGETVATYTVTYKPGVNGTGTEAADTKTEGEALTLKGAIFTRTGHKQTGWATTDGGEKAYELNASYTIDAAVELYPVWTAESYTITYVLNGGTINGEYPTSYTYGVGATLPKNVTREGFTFKGWYNASGVGPTGSIGTGASGNKTYYAQWEEIVVPETYTVTYKPGVNGTGTEAADTKTEGEALTLKGAIFTRTGHKQTGWATTDGGEKAYELNASYTTDAALELYPVWTAETYSISYVLNGGTINGEYPTSYTYGVGATLPKNVTREGFTFKGWYTAADGGVGPIGSVGTNASGRKTYYAQWSIQPVIISPTTEQTITVYEGDMATMSVVAEHAASYQWYVNYNDGTGWYERGENSPTYATSPTTLENDGYRYKCVVTGLYGETVESHIFTLEVLEKVVLPDTGDNTQLVLWVAVCFISIAGVLAIVMQGKKGKIE